MYILSQILITIADILYITSMLSKKKLTLVMLLFLSDVLFALHYLCLNSYTGCITILIDSIFLIILYFLEKNDNKKYIPYSVVITIVVTILACLFTWNGIITLLPLSSMLIYLTGMLSSNIIFVKIGSLFRNLINIIYMILITSYIGAGLEFILMLSALIGIILSYKQN